MASSSKDAPPNLRFSLRRADTSEQVAAEIRRLIERQGLRPGDRIGTEQELASEFGVGRPTIREGLRMLAAAHLVRASQGRGGGIFVANTPGEGMGRHMSEVIGTMLAAERVSIYQLVEARKVLEVPLAGLAAASADPECIEQLEAAIADAEGHRPGSPAFNAADALFHQTIAEAGRNEVLIAFSRWILDVLLPSLIHHLGQTVTGETILDEHRAILRAIRRGQPAAAERAMREHLDNLEAALHRMEEENR